MDIKLSFGKKPAEPADDAKTLSKQVQVVFDPSVVEFVRNYALTDVKRELGGILLGSCTDQDDTFLVKIDAAIEAKFTDAAQSSITFTHHSWDYMNQQRESQYPDMKVVGWFHTHPGFGIFLSGHDLFIHENFFDLPWQVAYVVDPHAEKAGIFGWSRKEVIALPFTVGTTSYAAVFHEYESDSRPKTPIRPRTRLLMLLIFICAFSFSGYSYLLWSSEHETEPYPYHSTPYYSWTMPSPRDIIQMVQEKIGAMYQAVFQVVESLAEDNSSENSGEDDPQE